MNDVCGVSQQAVSLYLSFKGTIGNNNKGHEREMKKAIIRGTMKS